MIALLLLSAFPTALLIAAFNDIYEFKIPNWVSIILIVAYFGAGAAYRAEPGLLFESTMLALGALVISFILFARNIIGAGDAKLIASSTLWVGASALQEFFVYTALCGAALAMAMVIFRKTPPLPVYAQAPWLLRLHQTPNDIPYAVAICGGALLAFPETHFFNLAFGGQ